MKTISQAIGFFLMLVAVNIILAIDVDEIVANFRKEYKKVKSFSADFEQTTLVAGKKRVAGGRLSFQKPNLFRQEYYDPSNPQNMTQLIVSDGKTILSYTPLIKQVTRQDLSRKNTEVFPGFGQALENVEKNYNLELVKDELAEKHGVYVLQLIPKKQDKKVVSQYVSTPVFDVLQVWIKNEGSVPVQVMYKDNKNETTFFLLFKNVKINEKFDESIFKFTAPAGVQVINIPSR